MPKVYHSQHFNLKKYSKKQKNKREAYVIPSRTPFPPASPRFTVSGTQLASLFLRALAGADGYARKVAAAKTVAPKIEYSRSTLLKTDITYSMIEIFHLARQFRSPRPALAFSRSHHDARSGR